MTQTIVIQVSRNDLNDFFSEKVEELLTSRYAGVKVTAPTVAEIWGCTVQTVNAHVRREELLPTNPGSSKYLFSLSDVLKKDPKHKIK